MPEPPTPGAAPAAAPARAPARVRRIGPYRIDGRLGSGATAVVYHGVRDDGAEAAVKVIRSELVRDAAVRSRLAREVTAGRLVLSPFVATLLDADTDAPRPWLAVSFFDVPTLLEAVAGAGALPDDQVLALARGLVIALADVHTAGIVHRDVKPSNVLMDASGPVLIDLGVAAVLGGDALTVAGHMVGTPGWAPPEQLQGRSAGTAADVFGWAATVAFAASGRRPFGEGAMDAVGFRVLTGAVDPRCLAAVADPVLRELVRAGLAADPDERPSVADLSAALGLDPTRRHEALALVRGSWAPLVVGPRPLLALLDDETRAGVPEAAAAPDPAAPRLRRPGRRTIAVVAAAAALASGVTAFALSDHLPPQRQAAATWNETDTGDWSALGSLVPISGEWTRLTARPGTADLWVLNGRRWRVDTALPLDPVLEEPRLVLTENVTGDSRLDFVVIAGSGQGDVGSVISEHSGRWTVVPFELLDTKVDAVDGLAVVNGALVTQVNECLPSCAEGRTIRTVWGYDDAEGAFVALTDPGAG